LLESGEYFTIEQLRQKLEDNVLKQWEILRKELRKARALKLKKQNYVETV
jgi:hypothetical protein